MSKFVLIYRAPKGYAPNAGTPEAWASWFAAIGANIVDPGDQVFVRDGGARPWLIPIWPVTQ